ncbi:MAG: hypothetical protein WCS42_04655 [Verrucomicrobiota bacterium]
MDNEIPTPPAPVPTNEVPGENKPPPPAAPPAADLVNKGEKSEREIQLERVAEAAIERAKKAEVIAAEKEREVQELKKIPAEKTPKADPKPKRKHNWLSPVIGADEDED